MKARILIGDVLQQLAKLPDASVQCAVTSPLYWGLRDYGIEPSVWGGDAACSHVWVSENITREMRLGKNLKDSVHSHAGGSLKCAEVPNQKFTRGFCQLCGAWLGCFGLEPTPELYIEHAVTIFREVRRVLRKDGTLWLNIGDSYSNDTKWGGKSGGKNHTSAAGNYQGQRVRRGSDCDPKRGPAAADQPFTPCARLKPKDLVGIPWMLAFALRADGWWLRQEVIWAKPNGMPGSQEDRCTSSHESVFQLTKNSMYYSDFDAIKTPPRESTMVRMAQDIQAQAGSHRGNGGEKSNGPMKGNYILDSLSQNRV